MLLKELKAIFHSNLDAIYGKEEVRNFFYISVEHYLNLPRFQVALQPEFTVDKTETSTFFKVLEDLKQHRPIQYIIGETEFYGLTIKVNKHVLIPRPETEELVDFILREAATSIDNTPLKVLDIGTGSGCIATALAKHFENAEVYALDISKEALNIAQQNASLNHVNISLIEGDILDKKQWSENFKHNEFDVIVSNPPYVRHLEKSEIKPNVLDNEPHLALFVDDNNPLQFYKAITDFALTYLKPNGKLFFEINQYLGNETKALLNEASFMDIELIKDLNGNERMLKGIKK